MTKAEIIKKRRALDAALRLMESDIITDKVIASDEYIKADTILVYADYNGEVATDKLICRALLDGKRVYAPVCLSDGTLDFYRIFALEEMEIATYGIREPLKIEYLKYAPDEPGDNTLCITPGTVFDLSCNRMGYGKGYYDRFFAAKSIPYRLGLAYDFQIVDHIDIKATDVAMTKIITPTRIISP